MNLPFLSLRPFTLPLLYLRQTGLVVRHSKRRQAAGMRPVGTADAAGMRPVGTTVRPAHVTHGRYGRAARRPSHELIRPVAHVALRVDLNGISACEGEREVGKGTQIFIVCSRPTVYRYEIAPNQVLHGQSPEAALNYEDDYPDDRVADAVVVAFDGATC